MKNESYINEDWKFWIAVEHHSLCVTDHSRNFRKYENYEEKTSSKVYNFSCVNVLISYTFSRSYHPLFRV